MHKAPEVWERYAGALDRYLAGASFDEVARHLGGVTRERARQIVYDAKRQLAYRVFRGLPWPLPRRVDWRVGRRLESDRRLQLTAAVLLAVEAALDMRDARSRLRWW